MEDGKEKVWLFIVPPQERWKRYSVAQQDTSLYMGVTAFEYSDEWHHSGYLKANRTFLCET